MNALCVILTRDQPYVVVEETALSKSMLRSEKICFHYSQKGFDCSKTIGMLCALRTICTGQPFNEERVMSIDITSETFDGLIAGLDSLIAGSKVEENTDDRI